MFPRATLFSAIAPAIATRSPLSTSRRHGDGDLLDDLRQRLTRPGAVVVDLRDLDPAALDALPAGQLMALARPLHRRPAGLPTVIALPDGCAVPTVNRVLWELPDTECLSAAGIGVRGGPVDLPPGTALRLFETTLPAPPLHNPAHVPVLLRLASQVPSCVPAGTADADEPAARLAAVAGIRSALCDDGCRLTLPSPRAFQDMTAALAGTLEDLGQRLAPDMAAASRRRPVATLSLSLDEVHVLGAALRMVPRELLSAPASIAVQDLLRRMNPAHGAEGLDRSDLHRIARLLAHQREVACTPQGGARSARDLVTLARLQRWTWPDSAHAKPEHIDDQRRARSDAGTALRRAWERRSGFVQVLEGFTARGIPLPEPDLLRRLGVTQTEALAAARPARHVRFQAPPADDDGPS